MQLFITEYIKKSNNIVIENSDLLSQLRKVLRASIGDIIWIQSPENESKKTRYEVRITAWDNKIVEWSIVSEQSNAITSPKTSMIIAMPNKWDKAELIVQKLAECGLSQIVFWPSERSIIRERNPKKSERLDKIIKEAVEQSRWRHIPMITFATDITKYLENNEVIVFDKTETGCREQGASSNTKSQRLTTKVWIVGPEGWLTKKDYEAFGKYNPEIVSLGATVLRMETAAIVGGWLLKNDVQ